MLIITAFFSCGAMRYQIKYLNTPTINVNQKQLKTGDWLDDDAVINWEKDTQAMRVLSEDNKVYTLSAKRYKESKSKKFSDFILSIKPMASRGMHTLKKDLRAIFENEFEILDELHIDLSEVEGLPEGITFLFSSNDDSNQNLSLTPENDILVITREDIECFSSSIQPFSLSVKFLLPGSEEEILITDWFEIIPRILILDL